MGVICSTLDYKRPNSARIKFWMEKKSKIIWQNLTLTIVVLFLILAGSMYYLNFLSTSWEFSNLRFRQTTGQVQSNYPSEVINLTNWKLTLDRKSTRLNSSHSSISYAV